MDLENGQRYEGELNKSGEREGRGKLFFPNGSYFEGNWLKDRYHGYGRHIEAFRDIVYEGYFESGLKQGEGKLTQADGETYEGDWKDN